MKKKKLRKSKCDNCPKKNGGGKCLFPCIFVPTFIPNNRKIKKIQEKTNFLVKKSCG